MECYDLIVIGGGPGGYKCALRGAQLGLKTACADSNYIFGGTCLREGCIPSKALLHLSHEYHKIKEGYNSFGISTESVSFDLKKMISYKQSKVEELGKGIDYLFKKAGVTPLKGTAQIINSEGGVFSIAINNSQEVIKAKNIVIATGSIVSSLPTISIDEQDIMSSSSALLLEQVPKKLVVIGAGAIGLEMSSIWSRLGAEVLVIEFLERIAPTLDNELAQSLLSILKKQGIQFMLSTKVLGIEKQATGLKLSVESASNQIIEADRVLVSVGRKPFTGSLFSESMKSVETNERGFIQVNSKFETNIPNIFAIGDVIGGAMLAHKAEEEGIAAAEIIAGHKAHVDHSIIPSVIYTHPAVASVGKTEQQLKEMEYPYKIGKCSFIANSRAKVVNETEGFVKILACKKTDTILGVHIIGACADTLINEASLAMAYGASTEDIYRTSHSHPDFNEALRDAAEDAFLKK